jgi:hypothetical protein
MSPCPALPCRLFSPPPPPPQDLNCLPGKRRKGKGCTDVCPAGKSLQTPQPIYLAGSQSLQFQIIGKGCY